MKEVSCTTKSNNVVIDGLENKPVIIDFGKTCKIVKAGLSKPKVNIEKSMNKFPNIAPEIHRGETGASNGNFRQNICSEDYLRSRIFGAFVVKFLNFLLACLS